MWEFIRLVIDSEERNDMTKKIKMYKCRKTW